MKSEATKFYIDFYRVEACLGIKAVPIIWTTVYLAIEPLLCRLRVTLQGLSVGGAQENLCFVTVDDVTVFIKNQGDIQTFIHSLAIYTSASSARVYWDKCESFLTGQWQEQGPPTLPGRLQSGKALLKYLGVFLGTKGFQNKNWEGVVEKV